MFMGCVNRCPICRRLFFIGGSAKDRCGRLTKETMIFNGRKFPSRMQLTCPGCRDRAVEINQQAGLPYEDEFGIIHFVQEKKE